MNVFDTVVTGARAHGLGVVGWFHPTAEDLVPGSPGTMLLLGPDGPQMWDAFQTAPEANDGEPHPMDRWSRRVIGDLADRTQAKALFPFGGPPWLAFQRWASRGEDARQSPTVLQVTSARGLWASYRGALAFADRLDLPPRNHSDPCLDCPAPCLTACPVDAFAGSTYNVPTCVEHLSSGPVDCRNGCLVRRACPAGANLGLPTEQRAFHMAAFLAANR